MTFWIIFSIVWVVCGVLSYGAYFAFFQRNFPNLAEYRRRQDRIGAFVYGILGPFGLFAIGTTSWFKHGFKFKNDKMTPTSQPYDMRAGSNPDAPKDKQAPPPPPPPPPPKKIYPDWRN